MHFDLSALDGRSSYKLMTSTIVPRPIAWVVSVDADDRVNAAPFSFFGLMSGDPPLLCFGVGAREGRAKDTSTNILRRREFVVNLVSAELLASMNVTAIDFPPEVDELAAAGLATVPSLHVAPPRIAASPVAFECEATGVIPIAAERWLILGRPLCMHVRDDAVIDRTACYIDTAKLDLVGRMRGGAGGGYATTRDLLALPQLTESQWRQQQASTDDPLI